ncbi:unnamed protein product [Urochloa humidicola]
MAAAAAAVTLLRLPLSRLSYHLRSVPSPRLPPPQLRISTSHRFLSSLGHGSASGAVASTVAAPDAERDPVDAAEESYEEESTTEAEAEAEEPRSFVLPRLPRPKLSVKERKELASYAHGLGKKLKSQQVGKGGVTPNLVSAFSDNLESNELLKLKIHGNCPGELPDVILQLEESTGSIAVDQIGRSVILYRPSTSKMKKRQEVAENARRCARSKEHTKQFVKSEEPFEERLRNSAGRRFVKSGSTFRSQQSRRPMASKGSSYSRG